jgi:methyltransferase
MLTREAFTALVVLVAVQRLWETQRSRAHSRALKAKLAVEHVPGQMPFMVAVHTLWIVAMLVEVWVLGAQGSVTVSAIALLMFGVGQTLRVLAIRELGERWTVTVVTPTSGVPPVSTGIYRYLRHPNYLGVMIEIAALPIVHGAYTTALVFSIANGILLSVRIRAEEKALDTYAAYSLTMGDRPRFLPLTRAHSQRRSNAP